MNVQTQTNRVDKLEQEIRRKEILAVDARNKGMYTTFSNYKAEVAFLKSKLQKLRTDPNRLYC